MAKAKYDCTNCRNTEKKNKSKTITALKRLLSMGMLASKIACPHCGQEMVLIGFE